MTCVAAGWPTTFCDRTAVKSSAGSVAGFLDRFCEFLGLSTPPSDLIIAAAVFLTRVRRLGSERSGSFMVWFFLLITAICQEQQGNAKKSPTAVTAWGTPFVFYHGRCSIACKIPHPNSTKH